MNTDVLHQLFLLFVFFLIGAVFAFVYDAFRVSGRLVPQRTVFKALGDVLFWITVTVVMFALCLKFNDGEIRFFMLAGVFMGALVYFNTVSRFVVFILGFAVNLIKKLVILLLKLLFIPLKLINRPVFVAFSFTRKRLSNVCRKIRLRFKIFKKFKR